jgi:cytochrome P450
LAVFVADRPARVADARALLAASAVALAAIAASSAAATAASAAIRCAPQVTRGAASGDQAYDALAMTERPRDDWDPRAASVLADQRRAYDELRERQPVAYSEFMGWSVFRYDDVLRAVADPATFSNASRHPAIPNGMDPPEHTRYRSALAPLMSDERMAAIEPHCRSRAVDLVAAMVRRGRGELLNDFAEPLALRTLCAFLGWPESGWEALGGWTHGNQQAAFTRDPSAGRALALLLAEHVTGNLAEHRAHPPGQDATDGLLATAVDGQTLSDEQIVSSLRNWIAGEGTVAGGMSLIVLHLALHADDQERLRAEPGLIPNAIEEILRVDDPLVANRRVTTRSVEVAGRAIPAGETVSLMWIAANRDPRAFEDADAVRLDRDTSGSLAWGSGIHVCLGAPFARLQLRVGVEELLRGTSHFEIAGDVRRSVYPSDGLAEFTIGLR